MSTIGAMEAVTPSEIEQRLSSPERKLVEQAYAYLTIFREGCLEMHRRARDARKIALLDDPCQDLPGTPRERRTLQLQTLRSTLNNCIADQMDNMPEAVMLPETPGMQDVAEDLTDVVRFVLDQSGYESLHRRRAEDLFVAGTAVTQVVWDPDMDGGQGNVALLRWPIEAFLWDPVAEDIQDARALIKVSWHPLSWYAAHYPDGAKYVGAEQYAVNEVGVPDAWAAKQPGDEERAMLMEYWYRRYDAKKRRYSINVAYIAGGALLDHAEDVYAHGMYPFVLDVFEHIEGLPVGEGMVQAFAPMQRYINRYFHYFDENMRMASKTRMLVRRDAQIDNDALTDWQKNIIEGGNIDDTAVRWFQTPMFGGAGLNAAIQLQTDIKQDSGQNQMTRGETAGGITAASAIAALQEAGGKITRMRTADLSHGFKRMCTQVIWLIAEFYTQARTRMVTGRDGRPREVDMSSEHLFGMKDSSVLPPPPYSVQVQVQRRNPMRVQAQNELFVQMYSMSAQAQQPFPLSVLLEMLTVDGKEKILPAVRSAETYAEQMEQMRQMTEQAVGQAQQLQMALQEKEVETENLKLALQAEGEAQPSVPRMPPQMG